MTKPKITVISSNKQSNKQSNTQKKKANIPKALREQVWIQNIGNQFEHKCLVDWCQNQMNVFDFHVGHNIPESQGGATNIKNLKPICARCNLSMGSQYSIEEWSKMGQNLPQKSIKKPSVTPTPVIAPVKKPWWLCC
jgi:5-methylcytosine-specific restriction endonuclease McrA